MTHSHEAIEQNEKKTLIVVWFTFITMIAEIVYGYLTHSMGLLADGYHMGGHALALFLTYISYVLIRKLKGSGHFPNGTEKIGTLTAYTSSILLGGMGFWIIYEALMRFIHPIEIKFSEAILVAMIGLVVNIVCIFIMETPHAHHHEEHKEDYNFKAAYFHILADALTSILAIAALIVGKYFGVILFDSIIGMLGGILIIKWAIDLIKKTVVELIDMKI